MKGGSVKVEQGRDEVHVGEAKDEARDASGEEQGDTVAGGIGRARRVDGKGLRELEREDDGERSENVGTAAVKEGQGPEEEG